MISSSSIKRKENFMHKISNSAKLFFKKFMWNMIYLFSYKSLAFMDEDMLYKEFLNEVYKSKKNDLHLKGIVNVNNQKDEKDIYKIAIYLSSFFPQIRRFLKFNFIDDNSFHLACNNFRFSKLPKGENLLSNRVVMKNSFVILLKGGLKAKLSKTIQSINLHVEEIKPAESNKSNKLNSTNPNKNKNNDDDKKEVNEDNKNPNHDNTEINSKSVNARIEYFERTFLPGDYFDYHLLNKNGISLVEFESEHDSDIIYLNIKKYNECFLSSIVKTEKQRKKFILNTIESMQKMPKLRFDMFYEHVNVEIYEKNVNEFVYFEGHKAEFIHVIYFGSFNLEARDPKKLTFVQDYEAKHLKMHTISKLEKGNFAGLEALDVHRTYKNTLKVTSSFGVIFSIDPRNIPTDSLHKIKDYISSIAKIKKRIYNDAIKSMEFFKDKFKIEYRSDLFNKIVKDNTTYLCDNIQEKVCTYKKDNIFETEECKNIVTDKKLYLKYEHKIEKKEKEASSLINNSIVSHQKRGVNREKENLENNLPSILKNMSPSKIYLKSNKKIENYYNKNNQNEELLQDVNLNKVELISCNKKANNIAQGDGIKKVKSFLHCGSTTYFKFNLNKKDQKMLNQDTFNQKKIFSRKKTIDRKGSQCNIVNEIGDFQQEKKEVNLNQETVNKDKNDNKTPEKQKIEAYASLINCINPSNFVLDNYSKLDKFRDRLKNRTTTNIKDMKSNLNNSLKNSILSRDFYKSTLIDDNFLIEKIPIYDNSNPHNNNYYSINSYSALQNKKNFKKIRNMIYKKDNEFFLSNSMKHCKEYTPNKFQGLSKEKSNNKNNFISNDSESDHSQTRQFNKKASFITTNNPEKTNFKRFKNMRTCLFQEIVNFNSNKENEEKAEIKLEIGKNMQNTTHIDYGNQKKLNVIESEAIRNKVDEENRKKLMNNTLMLNQKIKKINFKKIIVSKNIQGGKADSAYKFNKTHTGLIKKYKNPANYEDTDEVQIIYGNPVQNIQVNNAKGKKDEKENSTKFSNKFLIEEKHVKEKSAKFHNIFKMLGKSKEKMNN